MSWATPLHVAAASGDWQLTEIYCQLGADVNALTHQGETPLQLAVARAVGNCLYKEFEAVAKILLYYNADVNIVAQMSTSEAPVLSFPPLYETERLPDNEISYTYK